MKKKLLSFFICSVLVLPLVGCQSLERDIKDIESDWTGLDRMVEVYDYSGNLIKTYEGKIDIEDSETGGKIKFDVDGHRYIIYNAIVVVEEK